MPRDVAAMTDGLDTEPVFAGVSKMVVVLDRRETAVSAEQPRRVSEFPVSHCIVNGPAGE
jgi:hypothetical protein